MGFGILVLIAAIAIVVLAVVMLKRRRERNTGHTFPPESEHRSAGPR